MSLNSPVKLHPVVTILPQSVSHQEKSYHSSATPVATIAQDIVTVLDPLSREIVLHEFTSILHVIMLPHSDQMKLMVKD